MADWHFFANIFTGLVTPLLQGVAGMLALLLAYMRPLLLIGITVWISCLGLMVANGSGSLRALYRSVIQAAIIVMILQSAATYNEYVANLAQAIPREVGAALAGAGANLTDGAAHDQIWNKAAKAGILVWNHIPAYSLKGAMMTLCVAAYFVVAFAAVLGGFGVFLLSAVALGLLLTTGPIFVAMYPFPFLRRFANGWLSALASAIFTQIFSLAVLALLIGTEVTTVDRIISNAGGGADANSTTELIVLLEAGGLMYLVYRLLKLTPGLASAVAGGAYHSMGGISGAPMALAAAGPKAAAKAAGGAAAAAAMKVAKSAVASRPRAAAGKSLSGS